MDQAKRQAIEACGRPGCGYPEDDHLHRGEADETQRRIWATLGGPCEQYVASDAAVIYQKYLAITDNRAPQRKPGRIGKRLPLHRPCGHRHQPGSCPFQSGAPSPDTAAKGAAKARGVLGITPAPEEES